ncbi:hypothetical protein CMUS01_11288 [Colletotrichum musicola]|uniref:Uncharacterized protein n=1 Tax=Colletotrichum musicola TaxID=2175873 RepID=A0A8H6N695_9PEZI|nr:hypothetical protein CMUS01_11288 [Colletotrichum musicola]
MSGLDGETFWGARSRVGPEAGAFEEIRDPCRVEQEWIGGQAKAPWHRASRAGLTVADVVYTRRRVTWGDVAPRLFLQSMTPLIGASVVRCISLSESKAFVYTCDLRLTTGNASAVCHRADQGLLLQQRESAMTWAICTTRSITYIATVLGAIAGRSMECASGHVAARVGAGAGAIQPPPRGRLTAWLRKASCFCIVGNGTMDAKCRAANDREIQLSIWTAVTPRRRVASLDSDSGRAHATISVLKFLSDEDSDPERASDNCEAFVRARCSSKQQDVAKWLGKWGARVPGNAGGPSRTLAASSCLFHVDSVLFPAPGMSFGER